MFLLLNILFLSLVSLIPLASDLIGKWPILIVSSIFFNLLMFAISIVQILVLLWSIFKNLRMSPKIPNRLKTLLVFRLGFAPLIYAISIGIAFANNWASIAVTMSVAVVEVLAAFELLDLYRLSNRMLWFLIVKCASCCGKKVEQD